MVGETPPGSGVPKVKTFACPNCGAGVTLRVEGQSLSVVCKACTSVIDLTGGAFTILQTAHAKMKIEPLIPLGQRGKLLGTLWEVVGFMVREDAASGFSWSEYLLFNPFKGYRWLTESRGHWNLVTVIRDAPKTYSSGIASYLGTNYRLYFRGSVVTTYVLGEFYWRVKFGDVVSALDYIGPPRMLSLETDKSEQNWSIAEYLDHLIVKSSFSLQRLPEPEGIAPNQPSKVKELSDVIGKLYGIFLTLAFVVQFATLFQFQNKDIFKEGFRLPPDKKVYVTPPFHLDGGNRNLKIRSFANVQNNWTVLSLNLVNTQTGESHQFDREISYYTGYDSDGYWTEGSNTNDDYLSSIPGGDYTLSIEAEGQNPVDMAYAVSITRDVPTWDGFWVVLLLISVIPFFLWLRRYQTEQARWSDSDFSPYAHS